MTFEEAGLRAKEISKALGVTGFIVNIYGIEDVDYKFRPITKDSPYDVYTARDLRVGLGDMSPDQIDARIHATILA